MHIQKRKAIITLKLNSYLKIYHFIFEELNRCFNK